MQLWKQMLLHFTRICTEEIENYCYVLCRKLCYSKMTYCYLFYSKCPWTNVLKYLCLHASMSVIIADKNTTVFYFNMEQNMILE